MQLLKQRITTVLIHKKKQGQGRPAKIYVMKYTSVNTEDDGNAYEIEEQREDCDDRVIDAEE